MRNFITAIVSLALLLSPQFVSASTLIVNKHKTNIVVKGSHHRATYPVIVPRYRPHHRVVVVAPRPRVYVGYGHYHSSNDAWH